MESHHLRITAYERQALLDQYRKGVNTQVRLRAQILLLLAEGYSWAVIAGVLFCSSRTIARWQSRVELEGVSAILRPAPPAGSCLGSWWSAVVVRWVLEWTPQDFGFVRSRWCCQVIVLLLLEIYELQVSAETVRRWLHREQLVWRRPRPVVGPSDPQREAKLHALRQLLAGLPPTEIAVLQDEVDINTNPKIGAMWMRRGHQAEIPTPGTHEKRDLAGSLNWRTGTLFVTAGFPKQGRTAALFIRHLDDLRGRLRRYWKSMSSVTMPVSMTASLCSAISAAGAIGWCSITSPPTRRRPIRLSVCGGICTSKSPAVIGVRPWSNCSI